MTAILWRNLKWRFMNPVSFLITSIQPLIWLLVYGAAAKGTMAEAGIADYPAFLLPGLMLLVTFGACSSGGMLGYMARAEGSFQRLLQAPVGRWEIALGQMLESVLCALMESALLAAVALCLGTRLTMGGFSAALVGLLVAESAFFMAAVAQLASLALPNEMTYETVMNAIVLPLFFLSPALFPLERLSGNVLTAVKWNPLTYMIGALRGLMAGGAAPRELLFALGLFAVLGAAGFALALRRLCALEF